MGIIQQQSVQNTLLNYVGALVGIVSTLLIYPLDRGIYGLAQFLLSTSYFLLPFASLGINALIINFYPRFRNQSNGDNGFFKLSLLISICSYSFFLVLMLFFKDQLLLAFEQMKLEADRIAKHYYSILILCFLLMLTMQFSSHIYNLKKIVFPNLVHNFLFKIILPILVYLHFTAAVSTDDFVLYLLIYFGVLVSMLFIYLLRYAPILSTLNKNFLNASLKREIFNYLSYSSLNSIGAMMVYRIDVIMVAILLGFTETGSYGIFLMLTTFMEIPKKSITQISSPVIAESWKQNNTDEIKSVFKKSSNILFLIAVFLFGCSWLNIDEIVALSSNTEALSKVKYIFFYLGLAKLIELLTSVNASIIVYSKYYRYNLIFILLMGVITVFTNYYFINAYGVVGAAIATSITILAFNLIKLIFIKIRMNMHPFNIKMIWTLLLGVIAFFSVNFLGLSFHPFINLIIKSLLYSSILLLPAYYLRLSPEINNFIEEYKTKILNYLS